MNLLGAIRNLTRWVRAKKRHGRARKLPDSEYRKVTLAARRLEALLRSNMYFLDADDLANEVCVACAQRSPLLSGYPYANSPLFSPLIMCWCKNCGFGWAPALPFSLSQYYARDYSEKNRRDRQVAPAVYFASLAGPEEAMRPRTLVRYASRAKRQQQLIEKYVPEEFSILEFGSGPGYGLFFSRAKEKHAVEQDEASAKYLDYIGVKRLDLQELPKSYYDAVLSSHSLEHLPIEGLYPTLLRLREALKPEGVLCLEVPNGAHTASFLPGNHSPHTLFFSLRSLKEILRRAGFEVLQEQAGTRERGRQLKSPIHSPESLGQAFDAASLTVIARPAGVLSVPQLPERPVARVAKPGPSRTDVLSS